MAKISADTKTFVGISVVIIVVAWVVYAAVFMWPQLPLLSWLSFWVVVGVHAGVTLFVFFYFDFYGDEQWRRLKLVCLGLVVPPWVVFFAYNSGLEVFKTHAFFGITYAGYIAYFGLGMGVFESFIKRGTGLRAYNLASLVVFSLAMFFYMVYFYGGPYCSGVGYILVAVITTVLSGIAVSMCLDEIYVGGGV